MFKQLLTLALCFTTTLCFANSKSELQNLIHNLDYDLTVEWDQKDKKFFEEKMANFQMKLSELKNNGMTKDDINAALIEMVKVPAQRERMELAVKLSDMSSEESMTNFIWKERKNFSSHGASWDGDVLFGGSFIAAFVIGVALMVYFAVLHPKVYQCTSYGTYSCKTYEGCVDESSYVDLDGNTVSSCNEYGPIESCEKPCLDGYWYRK